MPVQPGRSRHPAAKWLEANWGTLPNNEWVAATATRLVAHDVSLDVVLAAVQRNHLDPRQVSIIFVTDDVVQ